MTEILTEIEGTDLETGRTDTGIHIGTEMIEGTDPGTEKTGIGIHIGIETHAGTEMITNVSVEEVCFVLHTS